MDATVQRIREIRRELKSIEARRRELETELDVILDLNSGPRPPKRKVLTKESARALIRGGMQ